MNSKGISVIFLIIAMLLMVIIGYVFSYLIPSKQKSVVFSIQSTQAFFIAQSGVEYAVRYATEQGWTTRAALVGLNGVGVNQRNLGAGGFTVTYVDDITNPDTLFSVGEVPAGTPRRSIRVSNFTSFLPQGLVLWIEAGVYQEPCLYLFNYQIRFYVKNIGTSAVTLNSFSASWSEPPTNRRLAIVSIGAAPPEYFGSYASGSGTQDFTNPVTINPNDVIGVTLTWSRNISTNLPVNISFYDNSIPSNEYPFTLSPTGSCTY
jgi:hypothetical protein